jgi:HlyD family secretion protein
MKVWLGVAGLAMAAAGGYWFFGRSGPVVVPFAKVSRERLVSTLTTNGKVEPAEWAVLRAPVAGRIALLTVAKGAAVRKGQAVGQMESDGAKAEVVAAEARLAQARAELAVTQRGASPAAIAEADGALTKARVEVANARERVKKLEALVAADAATKLERDQARERLKLAEADMQALSNRRVALTMDRAGIAAAQAKVKDAEAALELARTAVAKTAIVSPVAGTVYALEAKAGAVVENGAALGEVGNLDELRAVVYVDEPEMGRVGVGMPVEFTWDALPGRVWKGHVEKMPAQIVTLGSRQVGEVVCRLENEDRALPAGANVNAAVISKTVESALAAPKEAMRRENGQTVAYVMGGGKLERRVVKTGTSSITRVEILEGLKEGDLVALPTEVVLKAGDEVKAEVR